LILADSGVSAEDIAVIWYRKPEKPVAHPELTDPAARECSEEEYKELLRSFYGFFPRAKWVNDYWQMQKYGVKANQIWIAKEVGLSVPETLITNDIAAVRELGSRHAEIITKSMYYAGFGWDSGQYGCFTYILSPDEYDKITSKELSYAPAIFQQRINKVQELRVTVIGEEVIACEIQTVPSTVENIDWRIEGVDELPHRVVDIPEPIAARLKKMLKTMGLNFGAFDLIVDETGTYYFIEVNPNGQYYWMEILVGAPLTEAMVSLIIRLSEGFNDQKGINILDSPRQ
jgi:glutathione synthase/RimK-type ligase-like ATP-grasp enzyme